MRKPRSDGQATRERLLGKAMVLFAKRGYHETTVAMICRAAGVNVASVNYHFGSKDALYVESWKHAFELSLKDHPADGGVPATAPAEDRLRGRLSSLVYRIMDPNAHSFDMLQLEMNHPTDLLRQVKGQVIGPMRGEVTKLIREILGPAVGEAEVKLCEDSVMAQCLAHLLHERQKGGRGRLRPLVVESGPEGIERFIDHVHRFSLAGMRDVRERAMAKDRQA